MENHIGLAGLFSTSIRPLYMSHLRHTPKHTRHTPGCRSQCQNVHFIFAFVLVHAHFTRVKRGQKCYSSEQVDGQSHDDPLALCILTLFTGTFAVACVDEDTIRGGIDAEEDFRFSQFRHYCVWAEWGSWSSCSDGVRTRWRWMEAVDGNCRCYVEPDKQTRLCRPAGKCPNLRTKRPDLRLTCLLCRQRYNFVTARA